MAKIKVDLHDCYNNGKKIDESIKDAIREARERKIKTVEIIPGKGTGQLKKRVIRILQQKEIKNQYHRMEKDSKNWGRIFVYFKF